jgi:hypothetical protein
MQKPRWSRGIIVYFHDEPDYFDDVDGEGIYVGDDKFEHLAPLPVPAGWKEGPSGWHSIVTLRVKNVSCSSFGGITGDIEVADDDNLVAVLHANDWRSVKVHLKPEWRPVPGTHKRVNLARSRFVRFAMQKNGVWKPSIKLIQLAGPPKGYDATARPPILTR